MVVESNSFSKDRLAAARCFAHTMIVVDDEAGPKVDLGTENSANSNVRRPGRAAAKAAVSKKDKTRPVSQHWLDAKELIDNSMELGLICSILKPEKRENLKGRVALAARRADILCIDWEIYNDEGGTARGLIREIVNQDMKFGGRLRLIAIYTGEKNRQTILNSIRNIFDESERKQYGIKKRNNAEIISKIGLKIVYLGKSHGIKFPRNLKHLQVTEAELPGRLQEEFSKLSGGILANVALATIGSIRDAAHHVIGRFSGHLDGPYLSHRATIEVPSEAEEYAVDVVLSELKSAIDKDSVAKTFAGISTLKNRLQELSNPAGKMTATDYKRTKKGVSKDLTDYTVSCDHVLAVLENGPDDVWDDMQKSLAGLPKGRFMEIIGRFFSGDISQSMKFELQFAALTGVDQVPSNNKIRSDGRNSPSLGLGCVLKDSAGCFWLCLQASCDSVRLTKVTPFVFVPLQEAKKGMPDHVIPSNSSGDAGYLKLALPSKAYTQIVSIRFSPNKTSRLVKAAKNRSNGRLYFKDTKGNRYEWLATLKQRRALRTTQELGAEMSRLGFDEFEPLRKDNKNNNR